MFYTLDIWNGDEKRQYGFHLGTCRSEAIEMGEERARMILMREGVTEVRLMRGSGRESVAVMSWFPGFLLE